MLPVEIDFNYLLWQCRRGMLELDEILIRFLNLNYQKLSKQQQEIFSKLLNKSDAELFDWLIKNVLPVDPDLKKMILLIKEQIIS